LATEATTRSKLLAFELTCNNLLAVAATRLTQISAKVLNDAILNALEMAAHPAHITQHTKGKQNPKHTKQLAVEHSQYAAQFTSQRDSQAWQQSEDETKERHDGLLPAPKRDIHILT
jgi:hypothetical protein